jgi:hypothetical protein
LPKLQAAGWDREPYSIAVTFMAGCIFIRNTRIGTAGEPVLETDTQAGDGRKTEQTGLTR